MDGWCSELELALTLCLATCLYLYRLPPPPPLPLIIQVGVGNLFLRYREKEVCSLAAGVGAWGGIAVFCSLSTLFPLTTPAPGTAVCRLFPSAISLVKLVYFPPECSSYNILSWLDQAPGAEHHPNPTATRNLSKSRNSRASRAKPYADSG